SMRRILRRRTIPLIITILILLRSATIPDLLPLPTRRSSDLGATAVGGVTADIAARLGPGRIAGPGGGTDRFAAAGAVQCPLRDRSEEHTSELQSLTNLVCRLLLEKKKILHRNFTRHHLAAHP